MNKVIMVVSIACIMAVICRVSYLDASSNRDQIGIRFSSDFMSAYLQDTSLREILEKIWIDKGIWYEGDESLLEKKVSIRLQDVTLQEGLKRILSHTNHVLVYNREGRVEAILLFGQDNFSWSLTSRGNQFIPQESSPFSTQREIPQNVHHSFLDPFDPFSGANLFSAPTVNSENKLSDKSTKESVSSADTEKNLFQQ